MERTLSKTKAAIVAIAMAVLFACAAMCLSGCAQEKTIDLNKPAGAYLEYNAISESDEFKQIREKYDKITNFSQADIDAYSDEIDNLTYDLAKQSLTDMGAKDIQVNEETGFISAKVPEKKWNEFVEKLRGQTVDALKGSKLVVNDAQSDVGPSNVEINDSASEIVLTYDTVPADTDWMFSYMSAYYVPSGLYSALNDITPEEVDADMVVAPWEMIAKDANGNVLYNKEMFDKTAGF